MNFDNDELQRKARLLLLADLDVNGQLTRTTYFVIHEGERFHVKVHIKYDPVRKETHYHLVITRPAVHVCGTNHIVSDPPTVKKLMKQNPTCVKVDN